MNVRRRTPQALVIAVLLGVVCWLCCPRSISRVEADEIAFRKKHEYCISEKIDESQMHLTCVKPDVREQWIFEFESDTRPKHSLVVVIDRHGKVEEMRLIE